ncbi:MAG TPA: Ppx/GppA phosphatase family protein [Acidimicrobiales bacterium]|nr:Ppx/GppA phosphatase family protein [Acidimicrobiales bacterium]
MLAEDSAPVAALDCGTNSTRLLIVDDSGRALERQMRITRLGQGVDATHVLATAAITRTLGVLGEFRGAMDLHGVGRARLVATSAVRDAANAADFLVRARRVTGVEPEILSGSEEGRLSFVGATADMGIEAGAAGAESVLVVDIGGGSTELVVGPGRGGGGDRGEVVAVSVDVGCVRVTERFLHHDPPTSDELDAARRAIDVRLSEARAELPRLAPNGFLVGLAGTVSTLASLAQGLSEYDRDRIHHHELMLGEVQDWLRRLASDDRGGRLARPGMAPGREDVIVGGVLVLTAVMEGFGRDRCLVSEDDILNGLVASLR